MGAVPKIIQLKGADPEAAFSEAQQEARHLYGHSGTTGTLADADGCIVVSGPALLPWDGRRVAQQMLREGHAKPGGPVFLLALADPKRTRTLKSLVEVTGMDAGRADDAVDTAIRQKLPEEWGVVSVEVRDEDAEGDGKKGAIRSKVVMIQGKGRKVTQYSVRSSRTGRELVSKPTLAEARLWMKGALSIGSGPMHCVAEQVKEDGPLISGEFQVLKQTVAVGATIGIPATVGNGYYLAAGVFPTPGE